MLLTKRKCVCALMLAALVVMLSSCGGTSDSTAETISQAEFIKQADEICSKTEERQLALLSTLQEKEQAEGKNGGQPSEAEMARSAGLPPVKQQLEELEQLPDPESGSKEIDLYLRALADGVAEVEKHPTSLLSLDTNPFADAEAKAAKSGFKVCRGA